MGSTQVSELAFSVQGHRMTYDQKEITKFFAQYVEHHCRRDFYMKSFTKSGYALIPRIAPEAKILDVGCGQNLFKPYFSNLIGIDVIGDQCDVQTSLLEFHSQDQFDVVLCLGSIFGSIDDIDRQVEHIKTLLRPGGKIFWRNHPARPRHQFPAFFYPWTEHTHITLSKQHGFELNEVCKEQCYAPTPGPYTYRIYAEYTLIS